MDIIKSCLQQTRKNLDGREYFLFNSKQRDADLMILESFFDKYLKAIQNILPQQTENEIFENFNRTLTKITYIRIDETDMEIPPIILSSAEFIHRQIRANTDKEKMEKAKKIIKKHPLIAKRLISKTKMNATTRAFDVKSGIGIFAPALKTAHNTSISSEQVEGEKIFLHEFLHATSVYITKLPNGEEVYKQGVRLYNERGIYDDINEGINEYFTMLIIKKMYPNKKIKCGYIDRVEMITNFMSKLSQQEQNQIFSLYFTGKGNEIIELFKEKIDTKGKSIFDYLEYYQKYQVGLNGGLSPVNKVNFPTFGYAVKDCLNNEESIELE